MITAVYFDLDGVVADFTRGWMALHKVSVPIADVRWSCWLQAGFEGREAEFWAPMGRDFWANLPLHEDGMTVLAEVERRVGRENIALLSSPCETDGCCDGKRDWVARHLPDYKRRLFLGGDKALFAAPDKLLIDDHDVNCVKFIKAGGRALLVPRPWNAMAARCGPDGGFPAGGLAGLDAVLPAKG